MSFAYESHRNQDYKPPPQGSSLDPLSRQLKFRLFDFIYLLPFGPPRRFASRLTYRPTDTQFGRLFSPKKGDQIDER